jgi:hypothetical protein
MDLPLIAQLDLPMDAAGTYNMAIAIDGEHTMDVGVQVRSATGTMPRPQQPMFS